MKIKTPVTAARVRTHLTYYAWAYILVIVAAIFGWNLLYTVTAYRSPEDKRIDLYIQSTSVSDTAAESFLKPIWDQYVPDMEVVDAVMLSADTQDYYTSMQLMVYAMSQEGDIYILTSSDFKNYAAQGLFLNLQPYIEDNTLHVDDIDLSAGYVALTNDEGVPEGDRQLFGIPLYTLYGYMDGLGLDNRDMVLGVTAYNGNDDNVLAFLDGFLASGRGEKPDWLK